MKAYMKSKKIIVVIFVIAVAIVIAINSIDRRQTIPEQEPLASQQIAEPANPVQKPMPLAKAEKAEQPVETQPEPLDVPVLESTTEEDPMESFDGDEDYQALKALETVELAPDWEKAAEHPQLDDDMLSAEQLDSIGQATVPVLLPANQKLLKNAHISTGSKWYAAAINQEDHTVAISGNANVSIVPDTESAEPSELGDDKTSITRVYGIVEVSFKAFGIHYDITVECWDHQNDPRCTDDTYVLELVESLKMAPDKISS